MKKIILIALLLPILAGRADENGLAGVVNTLQGSNSTLNLSSGNTLPLVCLPWGMNAWTPQTAPDEDAWPYQYAQSGFRGFRMTHQPSPWLGDYGCFAVRPVAGPVSLEAIGKAAPFSHAGEKAMPHHYVVQTQNSVVSQITPSQRGAIMSFTFPAGENSIVFDCFPQEGFVRIFPELGKIVGWTGYRTKDKGQTLPDNFAAYFVATVSRPVDGWGTWAAGVLKSGNDERTGQGVGAYLTFSTRAGETIEVKVAASFISIDQAERNFAREVAAFNFESLRRRAAMLWNDELGRVRIQGGTEDQLSTFYTAMYRTMLTPRRFYELGLGDAEIHYSPYTGEVANGKLVADDDMWYTYRALHPWLNLMHPDYSGEILEGMNTAVREGDWTPDCFSPGYRVGAIGQGSAPVIVDAVLKGISSKLDMPQVWDALIRGANSSGPNGVGRDGANRYNEAGYVAYDDGILSGVSKTLEYAYADYCLSLLSEAIAKPEVVTRLYSRRAFSYETLYDRFVGFMRPRDRGGRWQPDFRPDTWGGSYYDGAAWHWSWMVPHDMQGLIVLSGGELKFEQMLDSMFHALPSYDWKNYRRPIHQMQEMVAADMGQYLHSNPAMHHVPYLYSFAGAPYKTQYRVREILDKLYSPGREDGRGLSGDEGMGQMSAWYLFSAMGFYPVSPVSTQYVIGSPLFDEVTMTLPDGVTFTVKAINNGPGRPYIQSAKLNGFPFDKSFLTYTRITLGGTLELTMGDKPNPNWAARPDSRPRSVTKLD